MKQLRKIRASKIRTGDCVLGFALVELVAVMGCLSILMGVAVVLLFQMFDLQIRSEQRSIETRSVNRLIAVFRNDVHEFGKPKIETESIGKEKILLRWQSDDSNVRYELHQGEHPGQQSIQRIEITNKNIRKAENYRLPDDSAIRFFEGKGKYSGLVALSLWIRTPGDDLPKSDEVNPFDRTLSTTSGLQEESDYVGIWRTILARYTVVGMAQDF